MNNQESDRQLFEYIRNAKIPDLPSLKEILSGHETGALSITELLTALRHKRDEILLIDARSEHEFNNSNIPYAENFPVLRNDERHNVGLIYKKYSQAAALWLAMNYADPKMSLLKEFLDRKSAHHMEIVIYCWRGGGRSGYLSKMISELGYKTSVLKGGHKEFRKLVNGFFSRKEFLSGLLELAGLTGSGKTMLLRAAGRILPVIDLENSARHYSSLLGRVPYEVKKIPEVTDQSAFENSVFSDISLNAKTDNEENELYLIESESRKVGDFMIPEMLFNKMQNAPVIKVVSSLSNRILRLNEDYFGKNNEGIEPMVRIMSKKEDFFKQQLSNKTYSELMAFLLKGDIYHFTETMLVKYYDVKYKDKGKKPEAVVNADSPEEAIMEICDVYNKLKQSSKNL